MRHDFRSWLRFLAGLGGLALMVIFFSSGIAPPGVCGEVLRHNQSCDIDASPLFYSEVENMSELEAGLAALRQRSDAVLR
ncbi:MAG: hypothetical protein ABIJ61_04085 [bacterium]